MKTFEGSLTIKWYKNHNGDKRPLTIDTENNKSLAKEIARIKSDFMTKVENGKLPYSVKIEVSERK